MHVESIIYKLITEKFKKTYRAKSNHEFDLRTHTNAIGVNRPAIVRESPHFG